MPDTVPVTIEVDAVAAAALADARTRAAMGRLVSRVLHPRPVRASWPRPSPKPRPKLVAPG